MNREKKIKVFLGSAYILIVFVFLLFFFNKFSFQDFSSYELIRENRNALEEIKNGNIFISSIIFLFGGIFIIYTAVKEINHLLSNEHLSISNNDKNGKSAFQVVLLIVFMNLIFSFDSILSAIAITEVLPLLIIAIITSGVAMLVLADKVTEFLERNRMYEVLGLFILLIVGIVLLGESGTAAAHAMHDQTLQIRIFDYPLIPMSKSTFYFSVIVLFLVEIIQTQYQRRLKKQHNNK